MPPVDEPVPGDPGAGPADLEGAEDPRDLLDRASKILDWLTRDAAPETGTTALLGELYEELYSVDHSECTTCWYGGTTLTCGNYEDIAEDLEPVVGNALYFTEDMVDNYQDFAEYLWDEAGKSGTPEWYSGYHYYESTSTWENIEPEVGCACLYMWKSGWGRKYVIWSDKYLLTEAGVKCPDEEEEEVTFTYSDTETTEKSFYSIMITTDDAYGFPADWSPTWSSTVAFDNLDDGEVGILYARLRDWSLTLDEDGEEISSSDYSWKFYSMVFDHDEPTFSDLTAVDATNYSVIPELDEKELAGLEDLYGAEEGDMASLLASYVGEIADTIATAAGETGQPLNKIKYVQIDEDVFDAIGAEEGKEAMTVSTVKEATVTYGEE